MPLASDAYEGGEGIHTTRAMAAGVADHVWKVQDVVSLLEATER
jgi:hypothetical protein